MNDSLSMAEPVLKEGMRVPSRTYLPYLLRLPFPPPLTLLNHRCSPRRAVVRAASATSASEGAGRSSGAMNFEG